MTLVLPSVPNVVRARFIYADGGDNNVTTNLHFEYSGGPPISADCLSLANGAQAAWVAHLRAHLNSGSYLAAVSITDLSSETGADGENTTQSIGTGGTEVLPAGVAVLINHKIARRYRGGKPRSYCPFFTSAELTEDGLWTGTAITALKSDWDAFIAAMTALSAGSTDLSKFVSVSYYHGSVGSIVDGGKRGKTTLILRGTPVVDEITSSRVNQVPASQRRRNTGV